MEGFFGYQIGGLIFGGSYIWRGLFLEILRYLNSFASQVLLGRVVQKVDKSIIQWMGLSNI